ncbi:MAG: DUF5698 domain-containing protein [Actinomycetia bacterium]|nr:DUF5698 domain-containing protein [Actinomycetes bacterium]
MNNIIWPIAIFFAIAITGSIGTLRFILMVRGRRFLSVIIVFFEACIGIAVISKVIQDVSGIYSIIAYGAGAAAGLFVGMLISNRISRNIMSTNIISNKKHNEIEVLLRDAGFGVTSFYGNGKDGNLKILNVICGSSKLSGLRKEVYREDSKAFIVSHRLEGISGGFFYNMRPGR